MQQLSLTIPSHGFSGKPPHPDPPPQPTAIGLSGLALAIAIRKLKTDPAIAVHEIAAELQFLGQFSELTKRKPKVRESERMIAIVMEDLEECDRVRLERYREELSEIMLTG